MNRTGMLCSLLVAATAAHADAVLEYAGGSEACHGEFTRVAVQGLSMRIDGAPPGQDYSFVFDAAEKTGVTLDHRRKQFFEMELDDDAIEFTGDVMKSTSNMVDRKTEKMQADLAQACAQSGSRMNCAAVDAMRSGGANGKAGIPQIDPKLMEQMMQQNMQHMTKEQRAQTEEAMKNMRASGYFGPQSEPVIEATGEKREVGGLSCTVERVTQDGQLLREDCRTTLDALGLDPADVKRMLRVIVRMQKYSSAVTSNLRLIKNVSSVRRDNVDPQHPLVERRCFDQGKPSGEVTLRVRNESVPADWFVTPADYSRMDMGMRGH